MSTIALVSGIAALLAGIAKYGLDVRRARKSPTMISVSIGNESIQVPSSCSSDQVAALIAVLQKKQR